MDGFILKAINDKKVDKYWLVEVMTMWLIFGTVAIIFAILNVVSSFRNKEPKWFRFASLSFTALTVCLFYDDDAKRVISRDCSSLLDVMPTMSKALWVCVILSIVINSISLFKEKK